MRSTKSINSLASGQKTPNERQSNTLQDRNNNNPTSPICRCRVMYLGSSVPHITKDGLQGIQEPLRELYPDKATLASGNAGIDSWLSVWSNGILIENVDETGREIKRFFKIDALHYCAAVKFVSLPISQQPALNPYTTLPNTNSLANVLPKFLPLDSPHARQANSNPPIFASILRRTTGIKVLECHAFICKREAAANALVRCCFHAYADTMYAKQIGADVNGNTKEISNTNQNQQQQHQSEQYNQAIQPMATRRSKSIAALNDDPNRVEAWRSDETSSYASKSNYDNPQDVRRQQLQDHNSMIRRKSMNEHYALICDNADSAHFDNKQQAINNDNLRKQNKLSKSMHHLNQNGQLVGINHNQLMKEQISDYDGYPSNQSTSASCINIPNGASWTHQDPRFIQQQVPHQPFYNPYAARVPSYPPQNLIDAANNGGTLRSIRSMAANSIASTLLRSKKHAKAMSMAQLNHDKITSFHQPHSNASTMVGPMMMPPVPPMFLPNLQARSIINGSQTMKVSQSRPMIPMVGPQHMNFEAMTPKEMKKLLKKSAKYGIDPGKFGENGLPLSPLRQPPIPPACHIPQSGNETMISQSMYSDMYGNDIPDLAAFHGMMPIRGPMHDNMDQPQMKPILVKTNPEFLKSKAGKKWLKQQKQFKKLLPPHLDGLPIVFGPPPVDALEPATLPNNNIQPPTFIPPHPGVPVMDSSGFYNPHPFYGQNGRASAASTLLRYSPHSQIMHDNSNSISGPPPHHDPNYMQRNHVIYGNNMVGSSTLIQHPRDPYIGDESSLIFGNAECGVDTHSRQFSDNGHKHQKRSNHMVEQSVISLGDENDYDDEEEEEEEHEQPQDYYSSANHIQEIASHSRRPKTSQSTQQMNRDLNNEHITNNYQDKRNFNQQQGYEQVVQPADDQSSYSSGIYKRGHINERAFSYSIRQEHKSSGTNSDAEYTSRDERLSDNNRVDQESRVTHESQQHQGNMFQRDQNDEYYHDNRESQAIPVTELTARLENQLNMKSFANSRIKSHM